MAKKFSNEQEIVDLLLRIGIRNNGYEYLKQCLKIIIDDDIVIYKLKDLSMKVASNNDKDYYSVEHCMRTSIEYAYNNNTLFHLNKIFKNPVINFRPTVSELLTLLVEYLRVYKKCESEHSDIDSKEQKCK